MGSEHQFRLAARLGRIWDVKWQLQNGGVCLDGRDECHRSALMLAAWRGNLEVVQLLIRASAPLDGQDVLGTTALHRAAWQGHADIVGLLTKAGAGVNLQNKIGKTPLHFAAAGGHVDCVERLLVAGGNPNSRDTDGWSPVHEAAQQGHPQTLGCLLKSANASLRTKRGQTPLHIAAGCGHCEVIATLIGPGVDLNALDNSLDSPLHYAAMMGHGKAAGLLLKSGCSASLIDAGGFSPSGLACCFGHVGVMVQLVRHFLATAGACNLAELVSLTGRLDISNEETLSTAIHSEMTKAGFVEPRARVQCELADVLQTILRRRWNGNMHLVGSYADGWGNNLLCMNGVTDLDADIDCVEMQVSTVFHPKGLCQCNDTGLEDQVEYENGHLKYGGMAANPAQSWNGSALRPAIDSVPAYICCCYPPIEVLEPGYVTQIRLPVIEAMRQDLIDSPCHLVMAAPPNEEGKQMRCSTSFLERTLLRSMTTVQGQVFDLIKYLLKRVIAKRVQGLKVYHAKTLMFELLDKTPPDEWQPRNLLRLTRQALQRLHCSLQTESNSSECMRHFFLRDAWLYLKKGHAEKRKIKSVINKVIEQLPHLLLRFMRKLQPVSDDGAFSFHPFLILPDPSPQQSAEPTNMDQESSIPRYDYYDLYNVVRELFVNLTDAKCTVDLQTLLNTISRLPDCAATTRECFRALVYLKYGKEDDAKRILRCNIEAKSGVTFPSGLPESGEIGSLVRQTLKENDWAKSFCFVFSQRPELYFLHESVRAHFPMCILYVNVFYVNFEALHMCLQLHLGVADDATASDWFKEAVQRDKFNVQLVLMAMTFCRENELLVKIIHTHRRAICDQMESRKEVMRLMKNDPQLMKLSSDLTFSGALARLRK